MTTSGVTLGTTGDSDDSAQAALQCYDSFSEYATRVRTGALCVCVATFGPVGACGVPTATFAFAVARLGRTPGLAQPSTPESLASTPSLAGTPDTEESTPPPLHIRQLAPGLFKSIRASCGIDEDDFSMCFKYGCGDDDFSMCFKCGCGWDDVSMCFKYGCGGDDFSMCFKYGCGGTALHDTFVRPAV